MSAVPVKDKIEYTVSLVTDFAKKIFTYYNTSF